MPSKGNSNRLCPNGLRLSSPGHSFRVRFNRTCVPNIFFSLSILIDISLLAGRLFPIDTPEFLIVFIITKSELTCSPWQSWKSIQAYTSWETRHHDWKVDTKEELFPVSHSVCCQRIRSPRFAGLMFLIRSIHFLRKPASSRIDVCVCVSKPVFLANRSYSTTPLRFLFPAAHTQSSLSPLGLSVL